VHPHVVGYLPALRLPVQKRLLKYPDSNAFPTILFCNIHSSQHSKPFKLQLKKIKYLFDKKLQFTYPQASIKDVQAKEKACSPQKKRTSFTSKHEFFKFFSIFVGHFLPSWIRILIMNPDPLTWIRI
jgi:hypothetical protein